MNTNQLKRFAQEARNKLMEQVAAKLQYVLTHDTAELRGKADALGKLKEAQKELGDEALVEKVAYTWFNRLIALRYMDVNDYQPLGVQVISPATEGGHVPALLEAAHAGHLPEELNIDNSELYAILDGKTGVANPDNEVFKRLLVEACNQLNSIFPFLFEKINDYTELLLPDDLTSNHSIVNDVVNGMSAEDCSEVEIIGWLYQFYISEKKDEVFASKSKVAKEDIPAATQLFTPRWIVEYMVQNTVGKLWLQNRPNSGLREFMPYFIESPSVDADDYLKISSPEEITLLDQACGSGHILVYGFELLSKIYEEEGYSPSEIPSLIINNNLFGFEIDERAAQLAGMAVLMKARAYHRRFFRKGNVPEPQILCYKDLKLNEEEVKSVFEKMGMSPSDELVHDIGNMRQATNFGSLIVPHASNTEILKIKEAIQILKDSNDAFVQYHADQLYNSLSQLELLSRKYHCVVDNPPYMGGGNANKELSDFLKANYPDSKADLMACFMETGLAVLHPKGYLGMINQHSWMFLSSYEKLRNKLIENTFFDTLLHLGPRTFPEIGGEVVQNASFTFWNTQKESNGIYLRLVDFDKAHLKKEKTLDAIQNSDCGWFYKANQKDFLKIPDSPIGYWLSDKMLNVYNNKLLSEFATPRAGMITGNNSIFLRFFHEININKIGFDFSDRKSAKESKSKWFPYQKGGPFRKWYGNLEYVVDFEDDGLKLRTLTNYKGKIPAHAFNDDYIFKTNVNWSSLTAGKFSSRITQNGNLFDASGSAAFPLSFEESCFLSAFLNSNISQKLLSVTNPTLNFQAWEIGSLPVNSMILNNSSLLDIIIYCRKTSVVEWDSRETSWNFNQNELIKHKSQELKDSYDLYQLYWKNQFYNLHKNEEELNKQFIEIYGLQDELKHDVPLKDITLLKEEADIVNGELVFDAKEVLTQFVSYAAGCMFGRYSIDKEGLILANQGETLQDYLSKVEKEESQLSFVPDDDNIIPILDDEWFEDDVVGRFHEFLKASFGEKNFRKNLDFVEESLGKDIRKFFTKDFYKDHIKRYKKRPIYWLFSSPKGHFNVLVYLHRYTPDTISTILNSYLREFIEKLNLQVKHLLQEEISGSASEQSKARKQIDKLEIMLADCREYEEILFELASERIELDLDDGVLVNYNKMGKAVATVAGLNDKKAKEKVRKFDWIDTSLIR
jgi:type II restriction/modification system DNA methylase subunit YeeA